MNADEALWIAGRLAGGALGVFTGFFKTRLDDPACENTARSGLSSRNVLDNSTPTSN